MAVLLHQAIRDALQAPAYEERSILTSAVLHATHDVAASSESDIYLAVSAFFKLLPHRLVRGSIFFVTTQDVDEGVELAWDSREEPRPGFAVGQGLLAPYDPNEPIAEALRNLERCCTIRAGSVRTTYETVANNSSFRREPYLHRRIVAQLPLTPDAAAAREREAQTTPQVPHATATTTRAAPRDTSGPGATRGGFLSIRASYGRGR